ncbi:MAG: sugar transferase [Anaerolineae bacterium]|nr:sugar transferase [Anaerolineae bacterium]
MSRILVIDDDSLLRNMIEMSLMIDGHNVRTAVNGAEGIRMAEEWRPDLVLLDVMMPGMSGFETLSRLREIDAVSNTPILMLTAKGGIDDKTIGFKSGADDYIVKPFDDTELKLRIAAHIRRYQLSSERDRYVPSQVVRVPILLQRRRSGMFKSGYQIAKRLFDIMASLLVMPVALPLMALVTLAILIESPGPVFFLQQRTGQNGRRFQMLKFRTMVPNAEALKEKYAHLNELTWPDFKITNDPRMTRIGKFLRRSSLDEVPQIFNILKGDMSLVGPRPTSFSADTYQLWQTERLEVRPGLTGLWQVKGRSDIDFVERVELDIEYVERQSWQLDMYILWQTAAAVIGGRGAH